MDALGPTFQKAIAGNASAIASFEAKSQSLKKTISELEAEYKALGENKFASDTYAGLLKELDQVGAKLTKVETQQAKLAEMGVGEDSSRWKSLEYDANALADKYARLRQEKEQLEAAGASSFTGAESARYAQLGADINTAKNRFAEMSAQVSAASSEGSRFGSILSGIGSILKGAVKKGFQAVANSAKQYASRIKQALAASNPLVKSLTSLKTLLQTRIKRMFISAIFDSAKESINALTQFSSEFDRVMSNIKNRSKEASANLAVTLGNLISIVEPVVTRIAEAFSTALTYINSFFAMLSGKSSVIVAKKQTDSYADSLDGAASSAEELKKQVYGFDELNKRSSTSSSASSGSSGADLFEEVPIDNAMPDKIKSFFDRIYAAVTANDWYGVGAIIAEGLNSTVRKVDDWINNVLRPNGTLWAGRFSEVLNGMVAGFDWSLSGKTVADGLNTVFDIINTFLTTFNFEAAGAGIGAAIKGFFENVEWDLVGQTFSNAWNALVSFIRCLVTEVDWALAGDSIGTAFRNFFGTVNFAEISQTISAGINGIVTMLQHFFDGVDFGQLASDFASGINGIFSNTDWAAVGIMLSDAIKGLLTIIVTAIEETDWQQVGNSIADFLGSIDWGGILSAVVEGVAAAIAGLALLLWGLIEEAWNSVVEWWREHAFEDGQFTIEGLLNGIWERTKNFGTWIKEHIFDPFINGFKKAFGIASPSTVMAGMGDFIIAGLLNGLKKAWTSITSFLTQAKSAFTNIFRNLAKSALTWGKDLITNMADGIKNSISKITNAVTGVADKIKDFLGFSEPDEGPLSNFHTYMPDMIDLMAVGIKKNRDKVINLVSGMASVISDEIQSGNYAIKSIDVDTTFSGFADKLTNSVDNLAEKLNAISHRVTFRMPTVALGGIVPYSVSAVHARGNSAFSSDSPDGITLNALDERLSDNNYLLRQILALLQGKKNISRSELEEMLQRILGNPRGFGGV